MFVTLKDIWILIDTDNTKCKLKINIKLLYINLIFLFSLIYNKISLHSGWDFSHNASTFKDIRSGNLKWVVKHF